MGYPPPDDEPTGGEVVPYLCVDCGHRMDVVMDEGEDEGQPA